MESDGANGAKVYAVIRARGFVANGTEEWMENLTISSPRIRASISLLVVGALFGCDMTLDTPAATGSLPSDAGTGHWASDAGTTDSASQTSVADAGVDDATTDGGVGEVPPDTTGPHYYVSTTGDDGNPGTATAPFRTITHAYTRAAPGVTIIVMPGTYTDHSTGWGIHLDVSGTPSQPVVVRSQVRGAAVIDGLNDATRGYNFYIDGSYNVVWGFKMTRAAKTGVSLWNSTGNQILGNEIYSNGQGVDTQVGQCGVFEDSSVKGSVFARNYVHDNGRSGNDLDHGFYLCGKNDTIVDNILVHNAVIGVQLAGYSTVSNINVHNNVMANNGTNGIMLWQSLDGIEIKNNIVYANGSTGLASWDAHGSGVVIDNNLLFDNGGGDYNFTNGGSNYTYTLGKTERTNPMFVNDSTDFHLRTGSPAIDRGLALSTVTIDFAGATRPQGAGYDIGAYER